MRILLCCEYYAPSVGGVAEVLRQIAERLAAWGHTVTIATSELAARDFNTLNGVEIKSFDVFGNSVGGMKGEIDRYRDFVVNGGFDVMMVKSAQQWTFDALWPVLDRIPMPKVFIPTGFPSLYEPSYAAYYRKMPDVLRQFEHLIFYTSSYRDIDMAKAHGLKNYSIIPNGASEIEFNAAQDTEFRERQGIAEDSVLLMTVGRFSGMKGHAEVRKAFALMDLDEHTHATLILNGNAFPFWKTNMAGVWNKFVGLLKSNDIQTTVRKFRTMAWGKLGVRGGGAANMLSHNKTVMVTDFSRPELVQAFLSANLFVFASYVEYSPLVLFEAAASGTPFLTVPAGNAEEIVAWTGGGVVCPAPRDAKGYTRVDPVELARHMAMLVKDRELREKLGASGRKAWQEKFTWEKISREYESVFERLVREKAAVA